MSSDTDLLPAELQRLLQLFSSLPDVRFPDLDAATLQDDVARVKERHLELMHIEAQQQAVRSALDDEHEALLKKGHRLLAYLKVFAEADEQLAEKVDTVSLPRLRRVVPQNATTSTVSEPSLTPPGADAPRKRGRPRKESATDALFGDAQAAQSA